MADKSVFFTDNERHLNTVQLQRVREAALLELAQEEFRARVEKEKERLRMKKPSLLRRVKERIRSWLS